MASVDRKELARLVAAVERRPELARVLLDTVARIESMEKRYRKTHWGDEGDLAPGHCTVPDFDEECVVLGHLAEIGYLTRKGKRGDVDLFFHEFTAPLPLLCEAPDGRKRGLVIVRTNSRYTVGRLGIHG